MIPFETQEVVENTVCKSVEKSMDNNDFEWLTEEICQEYKERARQISAGDGLDCGARRTLRIELQKRCNILEVEAINILNGYHIKTYVHKYGVLSGQIMDPNKDNKSTDKTTVKISKGQTVEELVAVYEEEIEYWKNQAEKDDGFGFEERD